MGTGAQAASLDLGADRRQDQVGSPLEAVLMVTIQSWVAVDQLGVDSS